MSGWLVAPAVEIEKNRTCSRSGENMGSLVLDVLSLSAWGASDGIIRQNQEKGLRLKTEVLESSVLSDRLRGRM